MEHKKSKVKKGRRVKWLKPCKKCGSYGLKLVQRWSGSIAVPKEKRWVLGEGVFTRHGYNLVGLNNEGGALLWLDSDDLEGKRGQLIFVEERGEG